MPISIPISAPWTLVIVFLKKTIAVDWMVQLWGVQLSWHIHQVVVVCACQTVACIPTAAHYNGCDTINLLNYKQMHVNLTKN